MKSKRKFTPEFKAKVVLEALQERETARLGSAWAVCGELGAAIPRPKGVKSRIRFLGGVGYPVCFMPGNRSTRRN